METSLKTGFAQIFSCCPKDLSCPILGGGGTTPPSLPVRLCTQQMLIRGGSVPRSNPLPSYILFFTKKVPLSYTFYGQIVPLSHTLFRTLHPF